MTTTGELRELYRQGKYRELTHTVWTEEGEPNDEQLILLAMAGHQLGEYDQNLGLLAQLTEAYPNDTEIGDTARRFLAHGLLQLGRVKDAQDVLATLAPSLARTNVRANELLVTARRGEVLPMLEIRQMLDLAMWTVPHETVCGHIVNNLAFALYEGRERGEVKPYVQMLPGFIEVAIGIYEETKAAKNHLAGSLFRASQIFLDIVDWPEGALLVIKESVVLWEQLVTSEGGERYQQNLQNARNLEVKISSILKNWQ